MLDIKLVKMIAAGDLSLNLVGQATCLHFVMGLNPWYNVSCWTTLSRKLLPQVMRKDFLH
jgi:hypothetical protein